MLERQSRWHLHQIINANQLLHVICDIEKRKCTINDMVRDSYTTTNKWHQSTTLVWYDCPIRVKIMMLITLLRHSIRHNDDHQCKKGMNAQSTLWWWCHMFYKNPSRSMKKVYIHSHSKKLDSLLLDFNLAFNFSYVPLPP